VNLKIGKIVALVDMGAQFSCVRSDVIEYLYLKGERCTLFPCALSCLLADGSKAQVSDAVRLHVRLLCFSWDHNFKVLNGGSFPSILGIDFPERTKMRVDLSSRSYSFAFAPNVKRSFSAAELHENCESYLQNVCGEAVDFTALEQSHPSGLTRDALKRDFPSLFSPSLGTAKCCLYDIELSDTTPVRTPPYRCASPKSQKFRQIVNELLDQGVVRPSKFQYASPALLVPKSGGGFRTVVDYRKVNAKVLFDSYPMPSINQAFDQFQVP